MLTTDRVKMLSVVLVGFAGGKNMSRLDFKKQKDLHFEVDLIGTHVKIKTSEP